MIEIEISSIFHEIFLIISYVAGLISAVIVGRKNNIQPVATTLILLISTITYLFFFNYFILHAGNWYQILQSVFPHIDRSFGLVGVIFGLTFSGMLLRIPLSILYKFSIPILIIYGISNVGCLGGHCSDVHAGLFHTRDYLNFLASFRIGPFLKTGLLADPSRIPILFKILAGSISAVALYQYQDKFKNPGNIFFSVFSSLFLISFVNQFLIHPVTSYPVFNRLLGLNIFQWAILTVTSLVLIYIFTNESSRKHRSPKLRIKAPSKYKIFLLYVVVLYFAFQDSAYISNTSPSIFIIGFSFSTLLLVLYFHERIQLTAIRYATILIILIAGALFLQTSFFSPVKENKDNINRTSEKKGDNRNVKLGPGTIHSIPAGKDIPQIIESHQSGDKPISLSPLYSIAEVVPEKSSDQSMGKPVIDDLDQ
jgi:hypothetical protein